MCYCDLETPEFYSAHIVKSARKMHKCDDCRHHIWPGESYEYISGMWDGYFSVYKFCTRCQEVRQWAQKKLECYCIALGELYSGLVEEYQYTLDSVLFDDCPHLEFLKRQFSARYKVNLNESEIPTG
jgi:hypothetical protein